MVAPVVISLGQIIVDLAMHVDAVPRPGEDVFANNADMRVGASYNMLHAVRQMGVAACHAGVLGRGMRATLIEQALASDGIEFTGSRIDSDDNGFCVALTDANAERTFVSVRGAEAYAPRDAFAHLDPQPGDVVYLSGYTLVHQTAEALLDFVQRTHNRCFAAIVDVSPVIADVDNRFLQALVDYRPIWTCNEREADLLAARLGVNVDTAEKTSALENTSASISNDSELSVLSAGIADTPSTGTSAADCAARYCALSAVLGSPLIVRIGSGGAWLCDISASASAMPQAMLIPGFPVIPVDTNGAGDCHTGVLCAGLAHGNTLADAVRTANAAAAIAVTRRGPATCPTRQEIDHIVTHDMR